MRKFLPLFLLVYFAQAPLFGQQNASEMSNDTKDQLNASTLQLDPSDVLYGFDSRKGEVLGDYYLDKNWRKGTVIFYPAEARQQPDTLRNFPIRLDLQNMELEFQSQYGIKSVSVKEIRQFEFPAGDGKPAARFVNSMEFGEKDKPVFLEILAEGKLDLLLQYKLWIKQPTYNAALDVGSKDLEIKKNKSFFYFKSGKLEKFKPSQSGLLKIMQNRKSTMEKYLETNKPDLDEVGDLAKLFEHYNGLE